MGLWDHPPPQPPPPPQIKVGKGRERDTAQGAWVYVYSDSEILSFSEQRLKDYATQTLLIQRIMKGCSGGRKELNVEGKNGRGRGIGRTWPIGSI